MNIPSCMFMHIPGGMFMNRSWLLNLGYGMQINSYGLPGWMSGYLSGCLYRCLSDCLYGCLSGCLSGCLTLLLVLQAWGRALGRTRTEPLHKNSVGEISFLWFCMLIQIIERRPPKP